ncbi:PA14 domain-containing protein [Roseovarius sp. M141]|uniref:PA14 domain-containing protein n=1 Tax=Roseovarius sp. M141 TaxID=2583806 RepID=UPI0020CDAEC0|nr:PA14 domain-containing protein [Roseovarius sp. M141]MCQ0090464.1 hypothetical protein [Roseovarius sp. M141]
MPRVYDPRFDVPISGDGFYVEYFGLPGEISTLADVNFDAAPDAVGTAESLNYVGTRDAFWDGGPQNWFAARYTSELTVETGGSYTFYLNSDDGSALYIDGERIISNDGLHGATERQVTVDLEAGTHDIDLRYFEAYGVQTLQLQWSGPETGNRAVLLGGDNLNYVNTSDGTVVPEPPVEADPTEPTDPTEPPVVETSPEDTGGDHGGMAGLRAEFFTLTTSPRRLSDINFDATPSQTQMIGAVDFATENNPFWDGGPADRFAARITGDLNVETAGSYTIYLTSDDGSALYIDGEQVIGHDGLHARSTLPVTLELAAGAHEIEVRYFENSGHQTLQLEWQGPDSNGAREIINGDSLSHNMDGHTDHGETPDDGTDDETGSETPGDGSGDHTDHGETPDDGTDGETDGETPDDGSGDHTDHGETPDDGTDGETDGETPDDGSDDHTDHGGSGPIEQPVTPAEIEEFVAQVRAQTDSHSHGVNEGMATEHMQLLDLVPRAEATHIAIADGDWFDPGTWYQGRIPDAGAQALIPEGISVTYDGESDASLFTVRVDGELAFATDTDTRMVVDTFVVSASGRLEIGTADNPIDANVNVDIVIANNGDIDVNWDPSLVSRGVISHGEVEIHGSQKDSFLKVSDAPMAGDTALRLAEVPDGWQVGDTLVVTGTHKTGVGVESQDEEVTITAINGNQITFHRALEYDHDTPREDLFAYIANTSRNITFRSEDGEDTAVHHRGHVMFMHNDDVDVRYAAFDDLGRTDKSVPANDVGSLSNVEADSNIKSRYPFHFHKTGTEDQDSPAMAVGNAVNGAPGWGFVHHSSNANFTDNVSFEAYGAGFAAESGDETGVWAGNMAIKSEGIGYGDWVAKQESDVARQDTGRTGDGFFFAGRLVEAAENVAVNTTNGFVWMHRNPGANPLSANLDHPEIAHGFDKLSVNLGPIQGFRDNEAYGTHTGVMVIKDNAAQQQHDMRSVFDGFLNWETQEGVNISYTAHYTLLDFDLLATRESTGGPESSGVTLGAMAFDMVFNGLKMDGFDTGMELNQEFFRPIADSDFGIIMIDLETSGLGREFAGFNPNRHQILTSDDLTEGQLSFQPAGSTSLSRDEAFDMGGIMSDSIGTREREYDGDPLSLKFYEQIAKILTTDGYYKTEDGRNVVIVEDFITDRATGDVLKFAHVITIEMTDAQIANDWIFNNMFDGAKFNGPISLGGAAPEANDDTFRIQVDQGLLMDLTANDSDADGDILRVDGFMDPEHGDVYVQEDGQLLYQPNVGFTGIDTFEYWATDDSGQYSSATVTIDVW